MKNQNESRYCMLKLGRIANRVFKGPYLQITYYYKLNQDLLSGFESFQHLDVCELEILTKDRCYQVSEIRELNVQRAFEMICEKQIVLLAKYDGEIAGHAVMKLSNDMSCGKHLCKRAYIHYCFVSPTYRGKNIYPYMLMNLAVQAMKDYNEEEIYISCDKKNFSSQRGIKKVGFQQCETSFELGWGGICLLKWWKKNGKI